MRELTFKGFLTQYLKKLSSQNTNSLYKLSREASKTNSRLVEPLLLYSLFSDKSELLLQATKGQQLYNDYSVILKTYSADTMVRALETQSPELSEGYLKVWRSYLSHKNKNQADNHTKELMRQKVKRLQEKSGITNYRIYTKLELNPGNLNAWLKYGESNKVSLETARKTLHFVENHAKNMPNYL